MRKTCSKCGANLPWQDFEEGVCRGFLGECRFRSALRAERRVSRELRGALTYISEGAECQAQFDDDDLTCNERETEYPCAYCAARRGLKRARKARGR